MTPRPDLAAKLTEYRFLIEQMAALATAISAALAAFSLTVPGYSRRLLLLPLVPFALWVSTLGLGCLVDWFRFGMDALRLTPDLACFPYIALVGTAPAVIIVLMLRKGAPLAPHWTALLAGLAAAAIGNFGLRFFHTQDAGVMVLVWQFGSVVVLSAMAGAIGPLIIRARGGKRI